MGTQELRGRGILSELKRQFGFFGFILFYFFRFNYPVRTQPMWVE